MIFMMETTGHCRSHPGIRLARLLNFANLMNGVCHWTEYRDVVLGSGSDLTKQSKLDKVDITGQSSCKESESLRRSR